MCSAFVLSLRRFLTSVPDVVLLHTVGFLLSLAAYRIFRVLEEEYDSEDEELQSFQSLRLLQRHSGRYTGIACLIFDQEQQETEQDTGCSVQHRCSGAGSDTFRPPPLYLQLHLLNYPRDGESSWENMEEPGELLPIGRRQTGLQAHLDGITTSIRRAADRISGKDPF